MQLHLNENSRHVATGTVAVLFMDRAGWHTTSKLDLPASIKRIFLPSRPPELNPGENIWRHMRANRLSNRVFDHYDAIVEAACEKAHTGARYLEIHRHARSGSDGSERVAGGINGENVYLNTSWKIFTQRGIPRSSSSGVKKTALSCFPSGRKLGSRAGTFGSIGM